MPRASRERAASNVTSETDDLEHGTVSATVTERGATRMDDKTSDASMEKRKKDGYF